MKQIILLLLICTLSYADMTLSRPPSKSAIIRVNLTNPESTVRIAHAIPSNGSCKYFDNLDFSIPASYDSCPNVFLFDLEDSRQNGDSVDCYYNMSPVSHQYALTIVAQPRCPDAIISLAGFNFLKSVFF